MSDKEPIISLRNLSVSYRPQKHFKSKIKQPINALKNIDLDIYRGEKLGIIGRNGSGKSTLMKILAGIIGPDSGSITIADPKPHIQLLSLGVGLEGHLSGRENAVLNGLLLGKSRKHMLGRIDAIKDFSELGDFFEYPVNTYSTGMVARLCFAVAMESEPDVLLLDELLGVGDASFAKKSADAIKGRLSSDKTVVLISHNAEVINQLCNRAIWIDDGTTMEEGHTNTVSQKYLNSFNQEYSKQKIAV